jgi:hypothetical protein
VDETNDLLTEVQELTWALVDEQATEKDVQRLEDLLLGDDEARRTYVLCMQMHADLYYLLGKRERKLPAFIEKLTKQAKLQEKSQKALPLVDMPPTDSHVPLTNGNT